MDNIITRSGDLVTIKLSGRLDTIASPAFEQELKPVIEGDALNVEVDCADLEYISSSGLRIFLTLQKALSRRGGTLLLQSMRPEIRKIFDMTGFSKIFTIK